jgi:hypothetical protein
MSSSNMKTFEPEAITDSSAVDKTIKQSLSEENLAGHLGGMSLATQPEGNEQTNPRGMS